MTGCIFSALSISTFFSSAVSFNNVCKCTPKQNVLRVRVSLSVVTTHRSAGRLFQRAGAVKVKDLPPSVGALPPHILNNTFFSLLWNLSVTTQLGVSDKVGFSSPLARKK